MECIHKNIKEIKFRRIWHPFGKKSKSILGPVKRVKEVCTDCGQTVRVTK